MLAGDLVAGATAPGGGATAEGIDHRPLAMFHSDLFDYENFLRAPICITVKLGLHIWTTTLFSPCPVFKFRLVWPLMLIIQEALEGLRIQIQSYRTPHRRI